MKLVHLFAVATLSLVALSAHAAPPVKDGNQGGGDATPFHERMSLTIPEGQRESSLFTTGSVPVGKRAVVENVSYRLLLPSGQRMYCFLNQGADDRAYITSTPVSQSAFFTHVTYRTLFFIESDSVGSLLLACERNSTLDQAVFEIILTGWLVDAD